MDGKTTLLTDVWCVALLKMFVGIFELYPVDLTTQSFQSKVRDTNPHTGRPFTSNGEHLKCREENVAVPSRDYNSMEDGTAAFIVNGLNYGTPNDVVWNGPILASDNTTVVLRAGKAIYDRLCVSCIASDVQDYKFRLADESPTHIDLRLLFRFRRNTGLKN